MLHLKLIFINMMACIAMIVCFLSSGCKKDKEPFDMLAPEGLRYIQLRPEQYFIYKDSASLTLDSVVVKKSMMETLHTPPNYQWGQSSYEHYQLTLSKIDVTTTSEWLSGYAIAAFSSDKFSMLSKSSNSYDKYIFRYPVDPSKGIFPGDSSIATMTIEGKVYSNIILATGNQSTDSRFYWAKGVGLIKYVKGGNTHKTYTLVRNN